MKSVGKMSVLSVTAQVLDVDGRRLFQCVVKDWVVEYCAPYPGDTKPMRLQTAE